MNNAKVMDKDRKASTYLAHAQASALDEAGGRFAGPERKPVVVGSKPQVEYPELPEGNPWKEEVIGVEPPTGVDINAQDAVGEPHEIAASTVTAPSVDEPPSPSNNATTSDGDVRSPPKFLRRA